MHRASPDRMLPNIGVFPRDLTPHALVVGDPARVRDAAALLSDVREAGGNREYVAVTGLFDGSRLTVVSHGVGAAGANVCFMELLRGGVRTFIRGGTCGGLHPDVRDGQLVIATGAVREDAATDHLMPPAYPALADRAVVGALLDAAEKEGQQPHVGVVVTEANFYPAIAPPRWKTYAGHGVLGVEMELAGLLVLSLMHGARAGGILAVDGNLVTDGEAAVEDYDPHRPVVAEGKQAMLAVALRALAALAGEAQG